MKNKIETCEMIVKFGKPKQKEGFCMGLERRSTVPECHNDRMILLSHQIFGEIIFATECCECNVFYENNKLKGDKLSDTSY